MTPIKILPETKIPFPCWLWGKLSQIYPVPVAHWRHSNDVNDSSKHFTSSEFVPSHYLPDQPTAPTCVPGEEPLIDFKPGRDDLMKAGVYDGPEWKGVVTQPDPAVPIPILPETPPPGYSAEELERDNPFNAWMDPK